MGKSSWRGFNLSISEIWDLNAAPPKKHYLLFNLCNIDDVRVGMLGGKMEEDKGTKMINEAVELG